MVKLYNNSGLPDEPMRSLLLDAQRLAGATGSVVVKVTRGGYWGRSHAKAACAVRRFALETRQRGKNGRLKMGWVKTDGGYVVMQPYRCHDRLDSAKRFFETAIHEFAHIYDFQHGGRFSFAWSSRGDAGRLPKWKQRPKEIRAVNRTDDALSHLDKQPERRQRIEEDIINLAVQMEAAWIR